MKKMFVIMLLLFSLLYSQKSNYQNYVAGKFEFKYPSTWSIILENRNEDMLNIKMSAKKNLEVFIMLSLMENFPTDSSRQLSVLASTAFGTGIALKFSGKDKKPIGLNFRRIKLAEQTVSTACFTIFNPKMKKFIYIESFNYASGSKGFFGMIQSQGIAVANLEASAPAYSKQIAEAYDICRSITIKK